MMWLNDWVAKCIVHMCVCVCVYIRIRMERKQHSMLKWAFNIDNKQLELMMACNVLHLATKN